MTTKETLIEKKNCRECGRKATYSVNGNFYCDKHAQWGLIVAQQNVSVEEFGERMASFSKEGRAICTINSHLA